MNKHRLKIHPLGSPYSSEVWIEYDFPCEDQLKFSFSLPRIDFQSSVGHGENAFQTKNYKGNWGLWEKRPVLEAFLQKRQNDAIQDLPYIEFQISPDEEYFLAKVHSPRQVYSSYLEFPIRSEISDEIGDRLRVSIDLDLSYAGLDNGQWYGNFYMILPSREPSQQSIYAGLQLDEKKLDFHLPRIFKRL